MKDGRDEFRKHLPGTSFNEAVSRITEALRGEGFGIFTRMDVEEVLAEEHADTAKRSVILSACHPQLAHRASNTDHMTGDLLPCHVLVAETETGSEVMIQPSEQTFALQDHPELRPVIEEVEACLRRVLDCL